MIAPATCASETFRPGHWPPSSFVAVPARMFWLPGVAAAALVGLNGVSLDRLCRKLVRYECNLCPKGELSGGPGYLRACRKTASGYVGFLFRCCSNPNFGLTGLPG